MVTTIDDCVNEQSTNPSVMKIMKSVSRFQHKVWILTNATFWFEILQHLITIAWYLALPIEVVAEEM